MILSFIFQGVENLQLCSLLKIAVAVVGPLHFQVNFRVRLYHQQSLLKVWLWWYGICKWIYRKNENYWFWQTLTERGEVAAVKPNIAVSIVQEQFLNVLINVIYVNGNEKLKQKGYIRLAKIQKGIFSTKGEEWVGILKYCRWECRLAQPQKGSLATLITITNAQIFSPRNSIRGIYLGHILTHMQNPMCTRVCVVGNSKRLNIPCMSV